MRILFVNSVCGTGSTGKIAAKSAAEYEAKGWEVRFGDGQYAPVPEGCRKWAVPIGNMLERRMHQVLTRFLDWHADRICSYFATRRFLRWTEGWKPDVVWIHNVHGYYLNYELLFKWIKRHPEMEVKWTLHDCWPWTGHCAWYTMAGCEKWRTHCGKCPQLRTYPKSWLFDNSPRNFYRKRKAFCGVKNMTIYTPSKWMAGMIRESFLGEYKVEVLRNEVDKSIFRPTESDFRKKYGLEGKKLVLGVASTWEPRKGLEEFRQVARRLGEGWTVVIVGKVPKDQRTAKEPANMLYIERTRDQRELAGIYTAVDYFFNPSKEESFSMVNLEAALCGTKVVIYDAAAMTESVEGFPDAVILRDADKTPEGFVKVIKEAV